MDKNVTPEYFFLGHGALLSAGVLYIRLQLFRFCPTGLLNYSLTRRGDAILKLLELVVKNDLHAILGYFV